MIREQPAVRAYSCAVSVYNDHDDFGWVGLPMIGERLRKLRKANNLTQEQVAAFLNVAKSTISQYENNINEPDIETIVKLADWYGVTVDQLLGRELYPLPANQQEQAPLLRERLTLDELEYLQDSLELYRKWKARGLAPKPREE
jgi:transcriptional regulator with XRE-family HTH domain